MKKIIKITKRYYRSGEIRFQQEFVDKHEPNIGKFLPGDYNIISFTRNEPEAKKYIEKIKKEGAIESIKL